MSAQTIKRVGFIGWRGMVGSVLMQRMAAEKDFEGIEPVFFSTSQVGLSGPSVGGGVALSDARDVSAFASLDAVVTCQGGDYTKSMLPALRKDGFDGYWIDAASAKRMDDDSFIPLDPLNRTGIDAAIKAGTKNFIGGNCTVSLMLMGLGSLIQQGWVEWISSMTYQAASGAGAKNMRELVSQMRTIGVQSDKLLSNPATSVLDLDKHVSDILLGDDIDTTHFGAPLAGSVHPWIDRLMPDGSTREEWKGHVEANKILSLSPEVPIDGICVRVSSMRCHSQAVTIKLKSDVPLDEIKDVIESANEWSTVVANTKQETLAQLTPPVVSGTLTVPVGRLRKLRMGPDYLGAFTLGDQLLWGAAEPLRRMLSILRQKM